MPALVIDGKSLARTVQDRLRVETETVRNMLGRNPVLAVVLVGDNPASQVYVRSKSKTAKECGIDTVDVSLPKTISDSELQSKLRALSRDPEVDGILLQLPLPTGLDEFSALLAIEPPSDVDGLHPINQGLLMRGEKGHRPCTPRGIVALIEESLTQLGKEKVFDGLQATVIGRSILVGKPIALMLLERNCTVTLCHSRTKNLAAECRRADILVAAIGKDRFVGRDFIKPGAIVIDVGINRGADGKLSGDVDFQAAVEVAAAVTPVPGGVGPMTIAMLLANTVDAARTKAERFQQRKP